MTTGLVVDVVPQEETMNATEVGRREKQGLEHLSYSTSRMLTASGRRDVRTGSGEVSSWAILLWGSFAASLIP